VHPVIRDQAVLMFTDPLSNQLLGPYEIPEERRPLRHAAARACWRSCGAELRIAFIRKRSTLPSTGKRRPTMLRNSFVRWDCQNSSFSPPFPSLPLRIRDAGNLNHEVHDIFFQVSAGDFRLLGEEIERMRWALAKENAVSFTARLAQILSPEIGFVDLRAKNQAAKARSQIGLRE
jgi:hypothetical protein